VRHPHGVLTPGAARLVSGLPPFMGFWFYVGLLVIGLLIASLVKLCLYLAQDQWTWDWWVLAAFLFAFRLFPWPWNRQRRLKIWF
jgi:hypothetical protein